MQSLTVLGDEQQTLEQVVGADSKASKGSILPDWLGVVASVACAIHCAAMPFVITFLPMLGLSFLADESFHKVMVIICSLLALLAFVPGWRVHRKWLPSGIAVAGLTVIAAAAFGLEDSCTCCELPNGTQNQVAGSLTGVTAEDEVAEEEACGCEHCAAAKADSEAAETSHQETEETAGTISPLLAGFTPWITPFGGVLLVSAHLINRRFSCQCGCCPTDAAK